MLYVIESAIKMSRVFGKTYVVSKINSPRMSNLLFGFKILLDILINKGN